MSEEEDEEPEGSGCAGAALVTVVILGTAIALYAVAPEVFVLGMWAVGWGALIVAAKRVPPAPNPSPAVEPERGFTERPQVGRGTVTRVGDSCTIVPHPSERRSYGLEGSGTPDSGGA